MIDRIESDGSTMRGAVSATNEPPRTQRRPPDLRTLRRGGFALSMVLAPLAVGVVRATIPLATAPGGKGAIAAVAAELPLARVELVAGIIAAVFLPFAIVGLTRLVVRGAPLLAVVGGCLAMVGWVMIPALVTSDAITYEMARLGANSAQFAGLWDQLNGNVAVNAFFTIFVVGHEVGTLLLGIALARARVVPLWAAAAVVLGILLHPVSFAAGIRLLDVTGFALVTAGFTAAALAVLVAPNDAWDLPPVSAPSATHR